MTIDRMKMMSFTKGTGDLVPVALVGYRPFATSGGGEYVAGAGVEIDVVIEGYANDEQFDGTYEYGVAVLTAEGNIRRIRTTYSSDGANALHDFQSDFLIISAGITEEAIRRLIEQYGSTFPIPSHDYQTVISIGDVPVWVDQLINDSNAQILFNENAEYIHKG